MYVPVITNRSAAGLQIFSSLNAKEFYKTRIFIYYHRWTALLSSSALREDGRLFYILIIRISLHFFYLAIIKTSYFSHSYNAQLCLHTNVIFSK